jgi:hypothetical protein
MVTIKKFEHQMELRMLTKTILVSVFEWETFKDNLYYYEENNRVKISPEELTWVDFNLIHGRHKPNYRNEKQRRFDVEHLLRKTTWASN